MNPDYKIDTHDWHNFLKGDREALGNLFKLHFADLLAYGSKIWKSEDVVKDQIQEMFIQLWEKRSHLNSVRNVKIYLLITLKNRLLQLIKSNYYDYDSKLDDTNLFTISSEELLIEREQEEELVNKIANALANLSPRQREIIYLRFYLNLDFKNLAEVMNMNVQSARNLLFRSLEKIRNEVKKNGLQSTDIEITLFLLLSKTTKNKPLNH